MSSQLRKFFHWCSTTIQFCQISKKHFYILQSSPEVKEIFPSKLIFPTYRRTKNLKEMFLPSKFQVTYSRNQREDRGCSKCDKKCDLCKNYLIPASKISKFGNRLLFIPEFKSPFQGCCYVCHRFFKKEVLDLVSGHGGRTCFYVVRISSMFFGSSTVFCRGR